MSIEHAVPASIGDPINDAILSVAEDQLAGFQTDPFGEIALRTALPVELVDGIDASPPQIAAPPAGWLAMTG